LGKEEGKELDLAGWNYRAYIPATSRPASILCQDLYPRTVRARIFMRPMVATGSYKDATIWDLKNLEPIITLKHPNWVNGVAISPDGNYLVTGGGDFIGRIWDIKTSKLARALVGHTDIVTSVAYSPDGTQVLTGSRDNTTRVWNADVNYNQRIFNTHTDAVWDVAFSPDGKSLVTGSVDPNDHDYKIWDLQSSRQTGSLAGNLSNSSSISYSKDGKFILTSNGDGSVRIWDAKTMRQTKTLIPVTKKPNGGAYDAVFSSDGKYVITGSSNEVALAALWDAKTGEQLLPLQHPDLVNERGLYTGRRICNYRLRR
jgi:WD40 repeat protein